MQEIELLHYDQKFRSKEAYKILRTNIEFSGEEIHVITVTSCTPDEGKSQVSFELAESFATAGKKVLLIDADMRKSVMQVHFKNGKVRYGLVHVLVGKVAFDDAVCRTDIPGYDIIFSGPVPPNPSELLGGKHFESVLKEAREKYDLVIIDTPPLGSVIDSAIVAKQSDGVMLVIESGAISYKFVQRMIQQLKKAECKILGCVLNKVNMESNGGYYGSKYYGRYYGKYYGKYYGNYGDDK